MNKQTCPICNNEGSVRGLGALDFIFEVSCKICGHFLISDPAVRVLYSNEDIDSQRVKLSTFLREQSVKGVSPIAFINDGESSLKVNAPKTTLYDAINQFPGKFSERIDRALLNISKLSKFEGDTVTISANEDYPLFYVGSTNIRSLVYIFNILSDKNYILEEPLQFDSDTVTVPSTLTISENGWNRIYELEKSSNKDSQQGFVAMWFDDSMDIAWENGFRKGIEDAGYMPLRIDNKDHNNKICDEIIAEIRRSRFLVCDFTGQRGGVYFEAGFGLGLGLPVIWTCKKDDIDNLHFDTRQYSHIVWEDEEDLSEKLKNRILATIT